MWWMLPLHSALAAPCPEPAYAPDLQAALRVAEDAYQGMDRARFEAAVRRGEAALRCQVEPVAAIDAASVHRIEAYQAFLEGDLDLTLAGFYGLRAAQPRYDLSVEIAPRGHPLREIFDEAADFPRSRVDLAPPAEGWIRIDGREAHSAPTERPYVWQRFAASGDVVETRYIYSETPPSYPVAPLPEPPGWWEIPRNRRNLAVSLSGAAVMSVGLALAGSAFWGADGYYPVLSPWDREDYWLRHLAGRYWSGAALVALGGAGMSVGGIGLLRSSR